VPHLLLLLSPLERLGRTPRVSVDLIVHRARSTARVLEERLRAGNRMAQNALAEILEVQAEQLRYRLTATLASLGERSALFCAALEALEALDQLERLEASAASNALDAPGGTIESDGRSAVRVPAGPE